jgi:hypothetical protein
MGLDMYLQGHKFKYGSAEVEDGFPVKTKILELGYWRKHPNLHGYIVQAFAEGRDECQDIDLGAQDIKNIISAIEGDVLPATSGFFFGTSESGKAQRKRDVAVFTKALAWLENVKVMKPEKIESDIGVIYKIEASDELPTEYRHVVYRASW